MDRCRFRSASAAVTFFSPAVGLRWFSRLLEGDFIDYTVAIPGKGTTEAVVSTRSFMESISRASIIISEKVKNPIRAMFDSNGIEVSCETSLGKIDDRITAKITGEPGTDWL